MALFRCGAGGGGIDLSEYTVVANNGSFSGQESYLTITSAQKDDYVIGGSRNGTQNVTTVSNLTPISVNGGLGIWQVVANGSITINFAANTMSCASLLRKS